MVNNELLDETFGRFEQFQSHFYSSGFLCIDRRSSSCAYLAIDQLLSAIDIIPYQL